MPAVLRSDQIRSHSICSTRMQTMHSYGADQLMKEAAFYATHAQHHAISNMQQRESLMVPVHKIVSWISMDIRSPALPMTLAQCTAHINAWHGILTSATSPFHECVHLKVWWMQHLVFSSPSLKETQRLQLIFSPRKKFIPRKLQDVMLLQTVHA